MTRRAVTCIAFVVAAFAFAGCGSDGSTVVPKVNGQLLQWSKCVAQQVQNQTSAGSAAIAGQCGNPPGGVSGDLSSNFIRPDFLQCLENEAQNPNATPQSAAAACSSTP
jgi:hypothetical protein